MIVQKRNQVRDVEAKRMKMINSAALWVEDPRKIVKRRCKVAVAQYPKKVRAFFSMSKSDVRAMRR